MSKRFKVIKEGAFKAAATKSAEDKRVADLYRAKAKDAVSNTAKKPNMPQQTSVKGAAPGKIGSTVFSSTPEPNRGAGADRNPSVPKAKVTRPTMEAFYTNKKSWHEDMREHGATEFEENDTRIIAKKPDGDILGAWSIDDDHGITGLGTNLQAEHRNSEYRAHNHLLGGKAAPGHYLMRNGRSLHAEPHKTAQAALSAWHNTPNREGVKIHHVKEDSEYGEDATKSNKTSAERTSNYWKTVRELKKSNAKFPKPTGFVHPKNSMPWKEDFAVSVGSGAVSSITDPTTNYGAQKKRLGDFKTKVVRRKKPPVV